MTGIQDVSLSVDDFDAFFQAVNGANSPFQWQKRLLAYVVTNGRWPEYVPAPTGSGKSSVVDIHVFANALAAAQVDGAQRPPRRLATVVNRRALVDSQHQRALYLNDRLQAASKGTLLHRMAVLLRGMRTKLTAEGQAVSPIDIVLLRGGAAADREWRDDPAVCMVLCATPDMWGSRLLFRGYGTSRNARPREAGLLAYDAVAVVDEAHLSRQLVCSARRIAELEATASEAIAVSSLQVVETTATLPDHDGAGAAAVHSVGVEEADFELDRELKKRLCNAKPLRIVETASWHGKASKSGDYVKSLADIVLELHTRADAFVDGKRPVNTVGCIVNNVATAIDTAEALKKHGLNVKALVGRMRQYDVDQLDPHHDGLLTVNGDPGVDVIVATQTLEVGIDVDLAALVTELSPGAALAQRFGRVNRLGKRPDTEIVVVVPDSLDTRADAIAARPYDVEDLQVALDWVRERAADPDGVAPWRLVATGVPEERSRRLLYQRPELYDAWLWSRTTGELFVEPELDLWLRDDIDPDMAEGYLVARKGLPEDETSALSLLEATPPAEGETFPVGLGTLRKLMRRILLDDGEGERRAFVLRAGEIAPLLDDEVRPGDTIVVDATWKLCRQGVVVSEKASEIPDDVYEHVEGDSVVRLINSDSRPELSDFFRLAYEYSLRTDDLRLADRHDLGRRLAEATAGTDTGQFARAAELLSRKYKRETDITVYVDDQSEAVSWMVIRDVRAGDVDEGARQIFTPQTERVTLADHSFEVAERAAQIASRHGLNDLVGAMELAGRFHDEGKRDARFQRRLGSAGSGPDNGSTVLAKSGHGSRRESLKALAESGLPTGWRHEQYSVVLSVTGSGGPEKYESVVADHPHSELILRLIGTSHGHGRTMFPHSSTQLLPADASPPQWDEARRLFDRGEWDMLIETTHHRYGVWGCAYLEALLRAADVQRSSEPRPSELVRGIPGGGETP